VDLIEVARVERARARFGARFERRTFAPAEVDHCCRGRRPGARFAARFAAKEAAMKALGTGWRRGIRFRDIEVLTGPGGSHRLRLHGRAAARAEAIGVDQLYVAISDTDTWAVACVVFEAPAAGPGA
jgi:holo-[acyl-carrier protein] synthase